MLSLDLRPLTTQIVGSYTKPLWLARHERMGTFDGSWWRPHPDVLLLAQQDAALLSIYEQERAGLDLVTDGEAFRSAYDRHFIQAMAGIDVACLTETPPLTEIENVKRDESGWEELVALNRLKPRITSEIGWKGPVTAREASFLLEHAKALTKVTVVGPVTLYTRLVDGFYGDEMSAIMALASALNQELRFLDQSGINVIQIDEPSFHSHFSLAQRVSEKAIAALVEGVSTPLIIHACYGYAIVNKDKDWSAVYPQVLELLSGLPISGISLEYEQPRHQPDLLRYCGSKHVVLGLLDLASEEVELPSHIARRIEAATAVIPPERLHPASDCGMWFLPRKRACQKIKSLVRGRNIFTSSPEGC